VVAPVATVQIDVEAKVLADLQFQAFRLIPRETGGRDADLIAWSRHQGRRRERPASLTFRVRMVPWPSLEITTLAPGTTAPDGIPDDARKFPLPAGLRKNRAATNTNSTKQHGEL